jgi:AraC family transcriptional regulator, transcriptional activator FtrA
MVHAKTAIPPHHVAIVVFDGVELFELAVAVDVFGTAITGQDARPLYRVSVCGPAPSVMTAAGFALAVPNDLDVARTADTIVMTPATSPGPAPAAVLDALRAASGDGKRIVSLCTGAFVLAAAGLLDGHTATTHWSECADLARSYPRVRVDPKVLYVDEGNLLTSAGSAASLDLCLHVVQRDHGTEIATKVARDLVVPLHRPGGQAQYIEAPMPQLTGADLFGDTLAWLREHLAEPVAVSDLAERAAMSPRTFARRFQASTGTTPLQWMLAERIRLAQRLLETTGLPVDAVAHKSGFGTPDNLRKHFARAVRTTPQAYRRAFRNPDAQRGRGFAPAALVASS